MRRAALLACTLLLACSAAPRPAGQADAGDPINPGADAGAPAEDSGSGPKACGATDPRAVPAEGFVLPDAGEAPFVDAIGRATKSLRVMVYQMGYGGILDAIVAKAKAGLDVRVILDGNTQVGVNQKYKDALEAAGAKVEWSDPAFSYMHAKVLVVDDVEAVVSTGNYLKSFLLKERNFAARVADPQDVADLGALFEADWARKAPDLSCTRLVVSPVNARDRIVALISSAEKTLLVESMQMADYGARKAIAARKAAGVDVRVLIADPSWIDANTAAAADLGAKGVSARWMSSPQVHVKAIVVDGARAYLGSENLSSTSLDKNREAGLFVTEAPAVAAMTATFEKDWASATSF